MNLRISFLLALALMVASCSPRQNAGKQPDKQGYIVSGTIWLDTDGNPIEAHGGGIMYQNGTYYWYGENHAKGFYNKTGISCYSSPDLLTWKNEGVVFAKEELPIEFQSFTEAELAAITVPEGFKNDGVCERPKVIYNAKTSKYVMWMHLDAIEYTAATAGVAVSDSPKGPFRFVKMFRPVKFAYEGTVNDNPLSKVDDRVKRIDEKGKGNTYRDMNLFVDDDGSAYVLYASENNATLYIVKLNDEYTDVAQPQVQGKTWARALPFAFREAPAPFKYNGKYYLITSGLTGWTPNPARYHVADSLLGKWTDMGDPSYGPESETTFRSQSTCVVPAPGKPAGSFIFMADRWDNYQLEKSTYIWLPFVVRDKHQIQLEYLSEWNLEVFDTDSAALVAPKVSVTETFDSAKLAVKKLSWKPVKGASAYRIYRNGQYIGITANTLFTLPLEIVGRAFDYRVAAIKLTGQVSPLSNSKVIRWEAAQSIDLSKLTPDASKQGFGFLRKNRSIENRPIEIAGQSFAGGLGTHAPSLQVYNLSGNYSRFIASVGVDAYTKFTNVSSVQFRVWGDGVLLYESSLMRVDTPADKIDVSIKGVNELKLEVTDGGDGQSWDHADWADARLIVD